MGLPAAAPRRRQGNRGATHGSNLQRRRLRPNSRRGDLYPHNDGRCGRLQILRDYASSRHSGAPPIQTSGEDGGSGRPPIDSAARRWLGPLGLVLLALFVINTSLVLVQPELAADRSIEHWVQRSNWGPFTRLMELTNWIAGQKQALLGVITVVLLAVVYPRAGVLMALGAGGSLVEKGLKMFVDRSRPTSDLVNVVETVPGHGYPSGHAVFFTWLAFMIAIAVTPRLPRPWRVALWVVAGLLVFTACLGRVWAGAHWPSDVLGGFLLSLGWCALVLYLAPRLTFLERLRTRR